MKYLKNFVFALIYCYQRFISPLFPPSCRFYPTCSNYALEAFQTYNFGKALFLTLRRLLRCHPFCDGGFDPLPKNQSQIKNKK